MDFQLIIFAAAFILLLGGAAVQDARLRNISNAWPVTLILLFAAAWPFGLIAGSLVSHMLHFAIVLVVGILLFAVHWVGGGDAKLYAAAALWFPLGDALYLFVSVALSGAVLAIAHLLIALAGKRRTGDGKSLRDRKLAYGIAIAAGAVIALPRALA